MKLIITALALTCLAGDSVVLQSKYTAGDAIRIETDSTFRVETVDMTITVDGEEREGLGGGAAASESRRIVQVDRVIAVDGGAPNKLRRSFEEISGSATMSFGDQEQEVELESPLSETVIELTLDDDEVHAEVVEGGSVDDALLEGHRLELALSALLPAGELAEGDEFEIESEALIRALEADLSEVYFPPPTREANGEGGERGRGRSRGMRGRSSGLGQLLKAGDWSIQGKLEALEGEFEGEACVVVAFEITGDGEIPEPERGEGGGRGDRGGRALTMPAKPFETNFDLKAEGKLYYSIEIGRPIALELEGEFTIESEHVRSRGDSEMIMSSSQEGTFTHRVVISAAKSDE